MPVDYAQIARENERKYGTEIDNYGPKLLADRYSDPTHFVYELLQNAEDALSERANLPAHSSLPKSATFSLFKDRLEFRHFGIPFAENHIRAICDIARSSKDKAPGAIGHFGIGFKSVYAFTRSPEVHSCGESFVIESLVRPAAAARKQTADGETLFVLPFNHAETSSSASHGIIARRLRELGPRTLLFLRRLDAIDWQIEGGEFGRYLRKSKKEAEGIERITLIGEEKGKATMEEHWLVFSREVSGKNGTSGNVEIAYQLQETKEKGRGQIRRVKDSPLCVYFATDLQTNLGFLVQGPFHLTQNRDNIRRDDESNKALAKDIGKLTTDSLSKLKALGLLSISALDAMPLEREPFETETGKLFLPVYEAVLQTLKRHSLIPGIGKSLVSGANGVLVRGRELIELFKPEQLKMLLGSEEECHWISPDITADKKATQRLHSYLKDAIDVAEVDADTLVWGLDDSFLQSQNVDWFARLYRVLLKHPSLWSEGGGLRDKSIIRLGDGSNVAPFDNDGAANAFLPTGGENAPKTVHPKLAKGDALIFLQKLGIRERDIVVEVLEAILPQYESGETPAESKHERNLKRIFRALEQKDSGDHGRLVDRLCEAEFLRATNAKTGKQDWLSPSHLLYFKSPRLSHYFSGQSDAWFLAEPAAAKSEKVQQWLTKLGVADTPLLLDEWEGKEEVEQGRWQAIARGGRRESFTDYNIHGLEDALKRIKKLRGTNSKDACKLSKLLWSFLSEMASADEDGLPYEGNLKWKRGRRVEVEKFDAHFMECLRAAAWIPDHKGRFRKPSEMHEKELPSGFERNRKLCDALKFQTPRSERLKEAGLPAEDIRWLELKERDPEFAAECLRSYRKRTVAPSGSANKEALIAPVPARTENESGETLKTDGADRTKFFDTSSSQRDSSASTVSKTAKTSPDANVQPSGLNDAADDDQSTSENNGSRLPRTDHLQTRVRLGAKGVNDPIIESREMTETRNRVDKAGVTRVKEFEAAAGRIVEELPHNNPGYDLHSRDTVSGEVVRYIEVKSTGLDWNGVLLSSTQFQKAQQLGERYWLYVVENADSPTAKVFPIQNPAGLSEKFIFDAGWKEISHAQQQLNESS